MTVKIKKFQKFVRILLEKEGNLKKISKIIVSII